MGLFKTYTAKTVSKPKNEIAVVNKKFVLPQSVTLVLREKIFSLSGDDFSIKDINGVEYLRCKGKALSIRNKKILYDVDQTPLLNIQKALMSLKGNVKIYAGDSDEKVLATIGQSGVFAVKKYVVEFFNEATGKNESFDMKCDYLSYTCAIFYGHEKEGAPVVAKVTKKLDKKTLFTGMQNYFVEIAPGVDIALMCALAICFDEYKNEPKNKK
ncbi:DUF567-domain-containing protein [Anaeromyces robustus]|uniref:DUF567-domain-containing protein n=1 Tax=Anaeromyces robustus TaxID=1754192 RepID=A0A1Y1XEG3_9FUNG|nr:DUF567-domain-containing protein [Anaeromyces robustus]|eukprot:ORX84150.1 DUF567-domain-containing protein [Anaeromyces robustus]